MEKAVRKFTSHAADRAYYHSLTPEQRVEILLQIIASHRPDNDPHPKIACVCRKLTLQDLKQTATTPIPPTS